MRSPLSSQKKNSHTPNPKCTPRHSSFLSRSVDICIDHKASSLSLRIALSSLELDHSIDNEENDGLVTDEQARFCMGELPTPVRVDKEARQ